MEPMDPTTYATLSILILAALLFFPITRLIWTLSVRRLQRRLQTELSQEQINGQLARARFLAVFVSLIFSALFYLNVFGIPANG